MPTALGSMCSKVRASASHAGGVHPALVGEGVAADVGLDGSGVRLQISSTRCAVAVSVASRSGSHALVAELELEGGQDRDEVGVAACARRSR